MLSLVSRCSSRLHSSYTPIACISNLLVSRFCISHRRPDATSAASTPDPSQDDIKRRARNEALKARYANDPEYRANYRARQNASMKARYANDPEYRETHLAKQSAWQKARYASDPEYFANQSGARYRSNAQLREAHKARVATFLAKMSPAAREKHRKRVSLAVLQQYHNDFISRQRMSLRHWVCRKVLRQELTWRAHEVELNESEVTHTCSGPNCGYEKNLKLWMKRKGSDPALYDCFRCFTSDWVPEKVLPIGYEHKVWGA
ncbi:hypothetical protein KCU89_g14393, partial [Aureobasidium melanogenum]